MKDWRKDKGCDESIWSPGIILSLERHAGEERSNYNGACAPLNSILEVKRRLHRKIRMKSHEINTIGARMRGNYWIRNIYALCSAGLPHLRCSFIVVRNISIAWSCRLDSPTSFSPKNQWHGAEPSGAWNSKAVRSRSTIRLSANRSVAIVHNPAPQERQRK